MKLCMIECAPIESRGSMGCQYIINSVRNAGYQIDCVEMEDYKGGYDIELVSIHHATSYVKDKICQVKQNSY